ncbi:MAG: sugar phosphate nucleotidyltransferase [Candidatus Thermoplasmatota archaeon]|nr:sugar phosphate nucleotidyltransferase [Candidatus Thermoplasmatota archaeon]
MAFVMAGGEGSRLRPLTLDRCKPAAPLGSRYRIDRHNKIEPGAQVGYDHDRDHAAGYHVT